MSRPQAPLFSRLPSFEDLTSDLILDRFLDFVAEKKLTLYPAQEEAILALIEGQNVILNTPTGSGKSLVATALHFNSLAQGKRSVYTCPIKALVNEKFLQLCREFGPDQVGMVTGDGAVNRDAPILCCTAEILANIALHEGDAAKVDDVIMDEFHYYSDRERGVAWQIPLLTLSRTRFLLMSATLGETARFEEALTSLNGKPTMLVSSSERPVPLEFEYRETPLHETVKDLIDRGRAPIYLVNFTQASAAEEAQNLMSVDFTSKEDKKTITERLHGTKFSSPYGKDVQRFMKHGVGLHHAGLLPKYRVLVEKLAQEGLLKVISGTDTLGVGVNIPIRTVLFTQLCKYDGQKTAILSVRDFHQIAGRAGRKGFDDLGFVTAQAPEHVIENLRMEQKAKADPKKAKKLVRAKPPERGFVLWSKDTFDKLITSRPEALESRFNVSHGMLLNVLSRPEEDGCRAMREIIRSSHETGSAKKQHRARAFELFRALVDRKIVEILPKREASGRRVQVNVSLQVDFSLNHALSLWLIDTLALLDPESETHALDMLTLVEAILESPDLILRKQLDRLKGQKVRELKEAGMEYDERMEELEKLEHPKPLREFIYQTFNEWSDKHPWVGLENIRPKSIAREMFETYQSFGEYVREYDVQRAEGLLLRYLSDVYKALVQTVPSAMRTDAFDDIVEYFGAIVRGVDSSLVEEWERLRGGDSVAASLSSVAKGPSAAETAEAERVRKATEDKLVRRRAMVEIFRWIRALAVGDLDTVLETLREWALGEEASDVEGVVWTLPRLEALGKAYGEDGHKGLLTETAARHAKFTEFTRVSDGVWLVKQTLVDPDGHNDWIAAIRVERSGENLRLMLESLGPVG